MANIEIRCTYTDCEYTTEKIPVEYAMQLLAMHNTAEHDAAPPPTPASAARNAKADRPSIDMGVTTERWVYFQKRWNTYKIATGLAGADIQGQLMDTCSEQLRYVMFQDNNDIEQQPEINILDSIYRLAVKAENVMVSRVVLNNIQQHADEGIRNFTARVKGQADLCQFIVIVDRYSGWPYVCQLTGASPALVKKLREFFVTYGIAEELSSDGGPEFTAALTQQFLRDWGVAHRLSSVAYPHSNTRAEIGVKSAKRLIMENTGTQGDVDIPAFQRAMLTYRNTPTPLDNRSPAEIAFGRQIRDFMPVMPGKYVPCDTWTDTAANREKALMERHAKEVEALLPHTKKMPPLKVGNSVRVQNQTGNAPRRWDKSGQVVEARQTTSMQSKSTGPAE